MYLGLSPTDLRKCWMLIASAAGLVAFIGSAPAQDADESRSDVSIRVAVEALNEAALLNPESAPTRAITQQAVIAAVREFERSSNLSAVDQEYLRRVVSDASLPAGLQLRFFVRNRTPQGMQHGRFVRLVLSRDGKGPLVIPVSNEVVFERPYTQRERRDQAAIRSRGGNLLMNRLVTYFPEDPMPNQEGEPADESRRAFASTIRNAVEAQNLEALVQQVHWDDVEDDGRTFVRQELQNLIDRGASSVVFEPRGFAGELMQWQSRRVYQANLTVEGYLRIQFADNRDGQPDSLWLEFGTLNGIPKLTCDVVISDTSSELNGKKLSAPMSMSAGYNRALNRGLLEHAIVIEAPAEFRPLRQANYELTTSFRSSVGGK